MLILVVLMGLMGLASLAGLAGLAGAAQVELRLWGWGPGSPTGNALAQIIEEFHATHPNIRVTIEQAQNEEKFLIAYATGVAPDLTFGVGQTAEILGGEHGALLPLNKYLDGPNGIPRSEFVDDLWSFSIVDGHVYQLAIESNERALYVNRQHAEQAGLYSGQTFPVKNWDDLLTWARRLTVRQADQVVQWGFYVNGQNGGDRWHWVWLNDGKLITMEKEQAADGSWVERPVAQLTHPNTIAALQYASDLIHEYGVSPLPAGSPRTQFLNGRYSMLIDTSVFVGNLTTSNFEHYLTMPSPVGVGKEGGRFSGASASCLAISRSTKHPEEAWEFMRFLVYEKAEPFTIARGGIPYLKRLLSDRRFQSHPWRAFAVQIMTYRPERVLYMIPANVWQSSFQSAWDKAIKREQAPQVALQSANEVISASLAEWWQTRQKGK